MTSSGSRPRVRMTGAERRQQLLDVGRELFGQRGFEATSIEEIAARADVSKPVVYEHFGGKEGLYAVVVDREMQRLLERFTSALSEPGHPRELLERAALVLLDYIEEDTDRSPNAPAAGQHCGQPHGRVAGLGESGTRRRAPADARGAGTGVGGRAQRPAQPRAQRDGGRLQVVAQRGGQVGRPPAAQRR